MKKYAIILAGGSGTRFGNSEMPKQYLNLCGVPIIIHCLEQFLLIPDFDAIIICVPKIWMSHTKNIIGEFIGKNDRIFVTEGGTTRNDTILCGCKFIKEKFGLKKDDIVVTHDSVRPFVSQRIIKENIENAIKYDAVDTAIPSTDTIVESINAETINSVPVRKNLYLGQTPQSFNILNFIELYDSLSDEEKEVLTDACKIFVIKNKQVKIVDGENYNIKITTPFDLKLAEAILKVNKYD